MYIGDALNWNCAVLTATTTQITCRTPPINVNYTNLVQPLVVVGRAMIDSTCGAGSCDFTYNNDTFPTVSISGAKTSYKAGENVTLAGTNFVNNNVAPIVTVGGVVATLAAQSNT